MRNQLQQELLALKKRVVAMSNLVQQSLGDATDAVINEDVSSAQRVYDGDMVINEQRFSIEDDAIVVLATQQPVAGDLRLLVGILEITTELERMGDYAKDIARKAMQRTLQGIPDMSKGLTQMCDLAVKMLSNTTEAFAANDDLLATQVAKDDNTIDERCETLHRNLIESVQNNNANLENVLRLLPVVHNIERFADRATNICERVVYIATGRQIEFDDWEQQE